LLERPSATDICRVSTFGVYEIDFGALNQEALDNIAGFGVAGALYSQVQRRFPLLVRRVHVNSLVCENKCQRDFAAAKSSPDQRGRACLVPAVYVENVSVLSQQVVQTMRLIALRSHVQRIHARRSCNLQVGSMGHQ